MSSSARETGARELLRDPRWELLPFESFDEQLAKIPEGATITITASPDKGIEPTVDLAVETATETEYNIVPHLAARSVADRDQLSSITERFEEAGITDVFVPGGDNPEPAGEFTSSLEVLEAMDELGISFDEVGITGYPEGHPIISDDELVSALEAKRSYGTYIATQICYNPETVLSWIEEIRADDVELPIHVGVPGVMDYQRLLGVSRKVGVGQSIRFVRKTSGILSTIKRALFSRGVYRPDDLIEGLGPYADDPDYGIEGLHLYTFNRATDTVEWREKQRR